MSYTQTRIRTRELASYESHTSGRLSRPVPTHRNVTESQTKPLSPPVRPWLALLPLGVAAFMANLDITIVNVSLPALQAQFHMDLATASWTLHVYNVVFATFLITGGRLGDLYGRRRLLFIGLLFFTSGSVFCGIAPSIIWLLSARMLQAVGAAILSAVTLALVHTLFPKKRRVVAMSIFGSCNAVGVALGPFFGGLLLPQFGWRSIFFANIPFALACFLLAILFVPETRLFGKKHIDVPGMMTISLTLFALVLAAVKGSDWGWTSPPILALFGGAVIGLVLFVVIERGQPSPILDLHLFSFPGFSLATCATFLYSVALQGGNLFLALYFINARGDTQLAAAEATLPVALGALLLPNVVSRISRFITPWLRCMLGMGFIALGTLLFCTLTMNSTYLDTMWREIVFGAGTGLCVGSFPVVALADVPSEKLGVAGGTLNTFRQIGYVLGIAFLIGIFSTQFNTDMQVARTNTMTMVQSNTHLPVELRAAILSQFFTSDMQTPPSMNDLLQMTDDHPSWQASKSELAMLSTQIEQIFDSQTMHAYSSTWAFAAAFPVLGLGIVVVLLVLRTCFPRKETQAAWNAIYFFSQQGAMTTQSIQRYLTAQQMSLLLQRPRSSISGQKMFFALSSAH